MIISIMQLCCRTLYAVLRVNSGGSFPQPLNAQEEKECLELLAKGDESAKNKLIEHNLRLVAHIVKKYSAIGCEQDDLISIGTIGLIKAISSYNPEKNTRLATYTARCIENEILMYFRSRKKIMSEVSLSEPIDSDKDGGELELMDILCCDEDMVEQITLKDDCERLRSSMLSQLTEREKRIIALRYGVMGIKKPLTQRETADLCGISRSYVSRIEKRAIEKLQKNFCT